jgi:hypothetical protein
MEMKMRARDVRRGMERIGKGGEMEREELVSYVLSKLCVACEPMVAKQSTLY